MEPGLAGTADARKAGSNAESVDRADVFQTPIRTCSCTNRLVLTLALLSALLFPPPVLAADFAKNFSGACSRLVIATGTAVDASGNQYTSGYFQGGTITLDSVTLTGIGPQDAFVAKLDASGNAVWIKGFGGAGASTYGQTIAVDNAGNVYLGGHFNNADLTAPALTLKGNEDAFVIKLDTNGAMVWARNYGGTGAWAEGQAIAVDNIGNVLLGGQFRGNSLTAPALTIIGSSDAFAIKLNATGATTWAKNFGGNSAQVYGQAIAVDGPGNVYLGGYFWNANLTMPALTKIGNFDAFAIKLNANGTTNWARNFGGSGANAIGASIAVDGSGHVALGGSFYGADLTTPALTRIGSEDAFAIKLDAATGATAWGKNFGGGAQTLGKAITFDGGGNIYLGGEFSLGNLTTPALPAIGVQDGFAIKLDPVFGNTVWAKNFGGTFARAFGEAIAVDVAGNVYFAGSFDGNLTTPVLTSIDGELGFNFKLDSAGMVVRAAKFWSLAACGLAKINATAVDASGNTYVIGNFGTTTVAFGNFTVYRSGYQDAFVTKLDATGVPIWARGLGGFGAGTNGQAIAVDGVGNVNAGGTFDSASLSTPSLTILGATDAFAVKLDAPTGNVVWAKNFGGSQARTNGLAIAADSAGNVYLGGYFWFANLTTPPLALIGGIDGYAMKLDATTGATTWVKDLNGGTSASVYVQALATDGADNVYLGGYSYGSVNTVPPLTALGNITGFAAKLDSSGAYIWARNFGGTGAIADVQSLAVDDTGNAYLAGVMSDASLTTPPLAIIGFVDAFAIKLDSTGATAWARNFGGSGAQVGHNAISVDGSGNVYLGGYSFGAAFTTPPLTKIGPDDAFAIKLDSTGATKWAKSFGGFDAWAHFLAIAVDGNGRVILGGEMRINNLTTPPLTLIGDTDALILGQTYYNVTYDGNGSTGGSVPTDLTANVSGTAGIVASNTGGLVKTGSVFAGWDTVSNGTGTHYNPGDPLTFASADATLYAHWVASGLVPILQSVVSRKTHGAAGTFDMPLSLADIHNPTTEPRLGPSQTIVFTFDMPVTAATAAVTLGTATAGTPTISGNSVIVGLTSVPNQQYVTVSLNNVSSAGAVGGSGSVRVGFLAGDVNQSRVITVADLGLVNAQLAQTVTASNFLKDVNASGALTVADKGITNANLTKALPAP